MPAQTVFSLEALAAAQGDSLILHWGAPKKLKAIVIDGGPRGIFNKSLKPRLEELRTSRANGNPLRLELVMVSHLDSDHVKGIVDLFAHVSDARDAGGAEPYEVIELWNNTFDDIVTGKAAQALAQKNVSKESRAVVATVGEGRALRDLAGSLAIAVNDGFQGGLVAFPAKPVSFGEGLKLRIIGPSRTRVNELEVEWDKQLKKNGWAKAAAYLDTSAYNLSSIIVLAELGKRRMLLTGDARGDDVLEGLSQAKLLKKTLHVDLLKVPHHGSSRNVELDFFKRVTADHYVISGDGDYGNPDNDMLEMLSEARGKDRFTLHLTYETGKKGIGPRLKKFFAAEKKKKKAYTVVFRDPKALSLRVDLGAAVKD